MLKKNSLFWSGLGIAWVYLFACNPSAAQIIPDATLPVNSVVTPQGTTFVIEGGSQAGGNLFHSFQEFSVPTGGEAYFNNAVEIQNIFSRVTGNSISNIDGSIKANGTANLFLINPNGIIFGPNSRLNIGGSFVGSTASSVNFADGTQFSAKNPQTSPLLTISVPIGLQFGETVGEIVNRSQDSLDSNGNDQFFRVQKDKTLALVGSGFRLEEGSFLRGGRIELGSVGSSSFVRLNPAEQGWALGYEEVQNFQDVQLSGVPLFGNNIQVRGRQVRFTGNNKSSSSYTNMAVNASELVEVSGVGFRDRSLAITTRKLIIRDGSNVRSIGNMTVNASDSVEVLSDSSLDTDGGGNLTIETGRLVAQGNIYTTTSDAVQGGNLIIRARDSVEVGGEGGIYTVTDYYSTGAGGNLTIETGRLLGFLGNINVVSYGQGLRGTLTLKTRELLPLTPLDVQIIPDRTLPMRSTVRTDDLNSSVIEGGTQVGSNLFHSFAQFSLPTASKARFNNALDIQNIISRVTGDTPSSIDGVLEANGTANLFLLNPNGIIFGRNAGLNIGGSFVASTASNLNFTDGMQFSAVAPQVTPRLTMSVPTGLQFGNNPGSILSQARRDNGIRFAVGRSLALVGGDITIVGDELSSTLQGARVDLGGVQGAGTVGLNFDGNSVGLSFPTGVPLADAIFSNADIFSGEYGFHLQGSRVIFKDSEVVNPSFVFSGKESDMTINASESVEINRSYLSTKNYFLERSGNITIKTGDLIVRDGGVIIAATGDNGVGGNVAINASNSVELSGENTVLDAGSGFENFKVEDGTGVAGNINIQTGQLIVRDGARVNVSSYGYGEAGSLTVKAGSIFLDNGSIEANNNAGGGNIELQTPALILRRDSRITTNAQGENNIGGNIILNADVLAPLENSSITANSQDSRGGKVIINTSGIFRSLESTITATGGGGNPELSGTVEINTPNVDPSQGLVQLAAEVVDTSNQIVQRCSRGNENQFTVTGRGGLPPSPTDVLSEDSVWIDLRDAATLNPRFSIQRVSSQRLNPQSLTPEPILEATGWTIVNGQVVLSTNSPKVTPQSPALSSLSCQAL